ncbi:hypothetical protein PIB30_088269 [Stylosanthes scabra]|uniref:Uncharacterized protein n=1 Tax=Stylosanthes scabra TaxID=79078 RepID=A0ABU6RU16_9FABA|nr:hypothetical protein [Stylosanthes scabra]
MPHSMLDHHLEHGFRKHARWSSSFSSRNLGARNEEDFVIPIPHVWCRIEGDGTSFELPQTVHQSELWVKSYRDRKSPMNSGELGTVRFTVWSGSGQTLAKVFVFAY